MTQQFLASIGKRIESGHLSFQQIRDEVSLLDLAQMLNIDEAVLVKRFAKPDTFLLGEIQSLSSLMNLDVIQIFRAIVNEKK